MIERVAHFIWLGDPLPDHLRAACETFTRFHPAWRIEWWDEDRIAAFGLTNAEVFDRAPDIVPADSVYQFRSDVARIEILHRLGGVYLDCDFIWQAPIDPHLPQDASLVTAWELQYTWVANGFIASMPGHPALAKMITAIPSSAAARAGQRANRVSGPKLWTPIIKGRADVHILAQRLLLAVPWTDPGAADHPIPGAVARHLWNHQRTLRGMNL